MKLRKILAAAVATLILAQQAVGAVVQSGATSDTWTIDPTSKAGRTTLYDSSGNELAPAFAGQYLLPIRVVQTAATAAPAYVWAMRNTGSKTVYIKHIHIAAQFSGTAAATVADYQMLRFRSATPTAGTALTVVAKRTTYPASSVGDARFGDTGLTTTGMTFDAPFASMGDSRQNGNGVIYCFEFAQNANSGGDLELAVNDGLVIKLNAAAVIGDALLGFIEWGEK